MRRLLIILFTCMLLFFSTSSSFAKSPYVLPYPSVMPGGISYKLHVVWEKLLQYWYFGDFGGYEYNLKQSDKYLVEAKTLFEYNQYLLGYTALQKSNTYFVRILPFLQLAKSHGKNIDEKRVTLHNASEKHIEVLQQMEQETPAAFTWTPEKQTASSLAIHSLIESAITQCEKNL